MIRFSMIHIWHEQKKFCSTYGSTLLPNLNMHWRTGFNLKCLGIWNSVPYSPGAYIGIPLSLVRTFPLPFGIPIISSNDEKKLTVFFCSSVSVSSKKMQFENNCMCTRDWETHNDITLEYYYIGENTEQRTLLSKFFTKAWISTVVSMQPFSGGRKGSCNQQWEEVKIYERAWLLSYVLPSLTCFRHLCWAWEVVPVAGSGLLKVTPVARAQGSGGGGGGEVQGRQPLATPALHIKFIEQQVVAKGGDTYNGLLQSAQRDQKGQRWSKRSDSLWEKTICVRPKG